MSPLLPDPDPLGLPAPAWLLKTLLIATFALHLLPMNLVLGGGFVAAWAAFKGRPGREGARPWRTLAEDLARLLPPATAFTITTGIAPLLFLQVLYGQLFYTSSVLMAWSWLAVIGLLLVGYYSTYGFSLGRGSGPSPGLALLSAGAFSAIALIFTNNMTLMLRPELWAALYAEDERGRDLRLADPVLCPRSLHFGIASFALTGLAVALLGRGREKRAPETGAWMRHWGLRLFSLATLVQLASGLWLLLSLPGPVRTLFLGNDSGDAALLWTSVLLALLSLAVIGRHLLSGTGLVGAALAGMAAGLPRPRRGARGVAGRPGVRGPPRGPRAPPRGAGAGGLRGPAGPAGQREARRGALPEAGPRERGCGPAAGAALPPPAAGRATGRSARGPARSAAGRPSLRGRHLPLRLPPRRPPGSALRGPRLRADRGEGPPRRPAPQPHRPAAVLHERLLPPAGGVAERGPCGGAHPGRPRRPRGTPRLPPRLRPPLGRPPAAGHPAPGL